VGGEKVKEIKGFRGARPQGSQTGVVSRKLGKSKRYEKGGMRQRHLATGILLWVQMQWGKEGRKPVWRKSTTSLEGEKRLRGRTKKQGGNVLNWRGITGGGKGGGNGLKLNILYLGAEA